MFCSLNSIISILTIYFLANVNTRAWRPCHTGLAIFIFMTFLTHAGLTAPPTLSNQRFKSRNTHGPRSLFDRMGASRGRPGSCASGTPLLIQASGFSRQSASLAGASSDPALYLRTAHALQRRRRLWMVHPGRRCRATTRPQPRRYRTFDTRP